MVLIALSLVIAVGSPASALDVKVTGKAEVAGYWEITRAMAPSEEKAEKYYSTFIQIDPVFKIADGLSLVTRFEGLKRVVGREAIGSETTVGRNSANDENFAMKRGYISARILGGTLDAGYMGAGQTGTQFMDYDADVFRIKYTYSTGPLTVQVYTEKAEENSLGATTYSESDKDKYGIVPVYKWSAGEIGAQFQWYRNNDQEQAAATPYRSNYYLAAPWFKATYGPLYVEGEINYHFGKAAEYLDGTTQDKDYDSFNYYLMGKYTFGPAYVGAQIARVQGQDPSKGDEVNAAPAPASESAIIYQPTLVLWNDWTNRWSNQALGTTTGTFGNISNANAYYVNNAMLYQVMAGYKPIPKLSIDASFTMALADEKPAGYDSDKYGNEFDIKATYKIYDNLSYMLAFGYLWTGDYFKGTSPANEVGDDWLLMHRLTLNF